MATSRRTTARSAISPAVVCSRSRRSSVIEPACARRQRWNAPSAVRGLPRPSDHQRDLVGAATLERELEQVVADLLRGLHRAEVLRDLLVLDVLGEVVGAHHDHAAPLAYVDARELGDGLWRAD